MEEQTRYWIRHMKGEWNEVDVQQYNMDEGNAHMVFPRDPGRSYHQGFTSIGGHIEGRITRGDPLKFPYAKNDKAFVRGVRRANGEDCRRVVVIDDKKAHLGWIVCTGKVYFARCDDMGGITTWADNPTQEVPEERIRPGMRREVDEKCPRIELDDGRLFWGIERMWYEVVQ